MHDKTYRKLKALLVRWQDQPTGSTRVCATSRKRLAARKSLLCLDPKDLNKNIKREHYYSRTIDAFLPRLHNKKYFSVMDTRKGYWYVELDEESSLLCTFNTPSDKYKFNRLPFGIKVSQDIFQKKLDDAYQDNENVCGIADDIIVAGETPQEHDDVMLKMLEASRKNNINHNSEKLKFKQQKVYFYGHRLSGTGIQPSEDKLQAIKTSKRQQTQKNYNRFYGWWDSRPSLLKWRHR